VIRPGEHTLDFGELMPQMYAYRPFFFTGGRLRLLPLFVHILAVLYDNVVLHVVFTRKTFFSARACKHRTEPTDELVVYGELVASVIFSVCE
jgi:hypothetical protein